MSWSNRMAAAGLALPAWSSPPPDAACLPASGGKRRLRVYLIKPSRYDDDGWVMCYRWGVIPGNTLVVVAGLLAQAASTAGIELEIVLWDEVVDGALAAATIEGIRARASRDRVELLIGLAGVQSGQYPRARDLALQFRHLGGTVLIGGFHVSSHPPSVDFLCGQGITVVIGEAESTLGALLDDYLRGELRLQYRVVEGVRARTGGADILVPRIEEAPLPQLDDRYLGRFFNPTFATIDTSRGCPFTCSYCSVKNVVGRTMRARDPNRLIEWVREIHDRHGVRNLLVVDDDLFRSPRWQAFFEGVAGLRREGYDISLIIQVDIESATHGAADSGADGRSRRFVDLAAAAGCFEVFMGFESFDPANLEKARKFHNEERSDRGHGPSSSPEVAERVKARYRRVVENWHAAGVGVHCGYMIGLPNDDVGSGARAARALSEIGVDIASFFACTPLPGTEDHEAATAAGSIVESDFNLYDSTHFVARHPRLTRAQLEREYLDAWRTFYSWRRLGWSLATLHGVAGLGTSARYGMLAQQLYFTYASRRRFHPMMGGIGRRRGGVRREVVTDAEAAARFVRAWSPELNPAVAGGRNPASPRTAVPG